MKMEKLSLPLLITSAYIEGIRMYGDLGVSQSELLMRRVGLNYEIESWISPNIPPESEYWEKSQEYKKFLTFELARMPQNHTMLLKALSAWNRLLMREQQKARLLHTKTVAARI